MFQYWCLFSWLGLCIPARFCECQSNFGTHRLNDVWWCSDFLTWLHFQPTFLVHNRAPGGLSGRDESGVLIFLVHWFLWVVLIRLMLLSFFYLILSLCCSPCSLNAQSTYTTWILESENHLVRFDHLHGIGLLWNGFSPYLYTVQFFCRFVEFTECHLCFGGVSWGDNDVILWDEDLIEISHQYVCSFLPNRVTTLSIAMRQWTTFTT